MLLLTLAAAALITWASMSHAAPDKEPTSYCIDTKYRLFERGDSESFSVTEDATCSK